MNTTKTGGPAFPRTGTEYDVGNDGMTLRDWFAGQFVASLTLDEKSAIRKAGETEGCGMVKVLAGYAYDIADAMITEKLKRDAQ